MSEIEWIIILFATSSHAIRAEKFIKRFDLAAKLVPVPRQLSSDCGLCVRVPQQHRAQLDTIIEQAQFIYDSIHEI